MDNGESGTSIAKEQIGGNIVKQLQARMYGNKPSNSFKQSVLVNRINDMAPSQYVDVDQVYKSSVNSLDVDISGRYLISSGKDGSLFIHDLHNYSGEKVYRCKMIEGLTCLHVQRAELSPIISIETVQWYPFDSGMYVTSGMDSMVRVWDSSIMKPIQELRFPAKVFQHHMSPSPASTSPLVAVASAMTNVKMVDLRTGQECQELRGHSGCVNCCRWSPTDPHLLATGSCDFTIRLWDARSSKACFAVLDKDNRHQHENRQPNIFKSHIGSVHGLEFAPNGRLLISLGSDNTMRCWDMHGWKNQNIPYGKINNLKGRAIQLATCGLGNRHFCFVPDQFSIGIFEIETGKKMKTLRGHFSQVNACHFHKDNMELYSGGDDRNILVWTVEHATEDNENLKQRFRISYGLDCCWDTDDESSSSSGD